MNIIPKHDFFDWAEKFGIVPDSRYPHSQSLVFFPFREYSRFWKTPKRARRNEIIINDLLAGLEPWDFVRIWRRNPCWPVNRESKIELYPDLETEGKIEGALEFSNAEWKTLADLIYSELTGGMTQSNDIYLIPDHGRAFLLTDHHGVVHIDCSTEAELKRFYEHMESQGNKLPGSVPDWTFKKPEWLA